MEQRGRPQQRPDNSSGAPFLGLSGWLLTLLVAALLYVGWINSAERVWTPEQGLGYALGIVGGSMMLLLLLYSLRKRVKWMRNLMSVKFWFQLHMLFGVLGPTLVVLHTNFELGSLNGRVALFSMLLVAGSGVIGRYIYTRIHHGLHGRKQAFAQLQQEFGQLRERQAGVLAAVPDAGERLQQFAQRVSHLPAGVAGSFGYWLSSRWQGRRLYRRLQRELLAAAQTQAGAELSRRQIRTQAKQIRAFLHRHRETTIRVLELRFYERLFSLWHLLHLPLFFMMLITGVIHIYAVHAF